MHLLTRIERYLKASGTPPTRFGRDVVCDPRLVHDMRRGRQVGRSVSLRVRIYLDAKEAAGGAAS